jgi:hypothetical protein
MLAETANRNESNDTRRTADEDLDLLPKARWRNVLLDQLLVDVPNGPCVPPSAPGQHPRTHARRTCPIFASLIKDVHDLEVGRVLLL